ncbi:endolytic transglycosylase MltG [Campylobacter sp. JMF_02 ED1]|uniref:endolytic transglycosylase MltG n=1 Tax=unclassified Campylobacter TaxID=2593542 RepID=UPI0022E9E994|nr:MULTISPECIES: endolytic transglycosylase MltG [unclassified Campylobacter]MDA3049127.1 endolytic transglycosylase MltG [Campylobacter sp. JMF_15 NE4]MDA3051448.1 endolytic transglycosylase MltG [Campylobacter sp. JMF_02 ED1]
MQSLGRLIRFLSFVVEILLIFVAVIFWDFHQSAQNPKIVAVGQGSAVKILSSLGTGARFGKTHARLLSLYGGAKTGELELSAENLPKYRFLYELAHAKPVMNEIKLIPGETTIVFLQNLAKSRALSFEILESEYNATAPFYEGFLVPETYKINKNENEKNIIKILSASASKFHAEFREKHCVDCNDTAYKEALIKASIIQKEAANTAEMPIVASVIENRLKIGMRLQMDGTLNYGLYSHTRVTPARIRTDTSHYNTYLNDGLPHEPVCVVSPNAIKAVFAPASTEFLYFMRNKKTGLHDFAKSQAEHERNVRAARNAK